VQIPQTYLDFKEKQGRKEDTVAIGVSDLKWMFTKSADEIAREKTHQAQIQAEKEIESKSKPQELVDWSTEHMLSPFTFDVMQMSKCRRMVKTGIKMTEKKI